MASYLPLFLGGRRSDGSGIVEVRSPWSGEAVATVARAGERELEQAAAIAAETFVWSRRLPAWRRRELLLALAERLEARGEELARTLVAEAGKPLKAARTEVARSLHTVRAAAGEAERLGGAVVPLDTAPWGEGKTGFLRRVPAGPVLGIVPFNFPLNLALHKLAPALAAGNPVVLKPATATPITACMIGEALAEAGAPPGLFSVVPCDREAGWRLVEDPRFRVLSFTGSPAAGWAIRARAGRKRVVLELGGNAAVVVCEDADLDRAVPRIVQGAFGFSGQSCISVQRILVHETRREELEAKLVAAAGALAAGDPASARTDVGPLISKDAADRVMAWIGEARAGGARLLCGGERQGGLVTPALLADVPENARLERQEAFGPVATLRSFRDFGEALRRVNDSVYGLQAGVFTGDLGRALRAWDGIEAGAVLINEVPTFRVDTMPYGGVKESGLGREGPAWAMEHMTEFRLLVIHEEDKK